MKLYRILLQELTNFPEFKFIFCLIQPNPTAGFVLPFPLFLWRCSLCDLGQSKLSTCSVCLHVRISEGLNPDTLLWSVLSEEVCHVLLAGRAPQGLTSRLQLAVTISWGFGSEPACLVLVSTTAAQIPVPSSSPSALLMPHFLSRLPQCATTYSSEETTTPSCQEDPTK